MDDNLPFEAWLTERDREERSHLAYFLAQLDSPRARELIPPPAWQALRSEYAARHWAIEQRARVEALLHAARTMAPRDPVGALERLARIRLLDPPCPEGWTLAMELHARLGQGDAA